MQKLEAFAEGKFQIGKLRIERKYIKVGCLAEDQKLGKGDKFTFYTRVYDSELLNTTDENPERRYCNFIAQVGLVHGFSEDSDTWLETAYNLALNGMLVHIIDLESFGYAAGPRGRCLSIPS